MKTLHIVYGTTGEYSDRTQWAVQAFDTQHEAEAYADKCTEQANDAFVLNRTNYYDLDGTEADPYARFDYTGTSYYVGTVSYMGDKHGGHE